MRLAKMLEAGCWPLKIALVWLLWPVPLTYAQTFKISDGGTGLQTSWYKLQEKNIDVRGTAGDSYTFKLTLVQFLVPRFTLQIEAPHGGSSLRATAELMQGDAVLVNGGFIRSYNPVSPAGYLKLGRRDISYPGDVDIDPIVSGVICVEGMRATVFRAPTIKEFRARFTGHANCMQSGPLLVKDGERALDIKSEEPRILRFIRQHHERSLIMIDSSGGISFGVTSPVALPDLLPVISSRDGGLGAFQVLNLQGSRHSGLIVMRNGRVRYEIGEPESAQATIVIAKPID